MHISYKKNFIKKKRRNLNISISLRLARSISVLRATADCVRPNQLG